MEKCNPENQSSASCLSVQAVEKQDMDKFQDPDPLKTKEIYAQMDDTLERLTKTNFIMLMKEVGKLTINTEARLKGIVDLIYKKAVGHPAISELYANMCRSLMGLKVPSAANPGMTLNFRKLILNQLCTGFENIWQENPEILEKQNKMNDITKEEECKKQQEEMEEAKEEGRRHAIGIINLMCELYKLKMITKAIMHDSITKLLKKQDDNSLECLCTLLSAIGSDLGRPITDQYYNQIRKIMKNKRVSPRIRGCLQNVLDLQKMAPPKTEENVAKIEKTRQQDDVPAAGHTVPADTEPLHPYSSVMKKEEMVSSTTTIQENTLSNNEDKLKAEGLEKDSSAMKKKVIVFFKMCRQEIQEELQKQRQEVKMLKCLSQAIVEDSERFFTKLIETRCSEVRQLIQAKEKEMMSEAEELIETLEQELEEMKWPERSGRHLQNIGVDPHFLQELPSITEAFEEVRTSSSEMQQQFENSSKLQFVEFSKAVEEILEVYTIRSLITSRQPVEEKDLAEERQQLREELDEIKAEVWRELLGNITFVCELFKFKMISESFIDNCIVKLLKDGDDDSLEGLCTILLNIGKDLDYENHKDRIEEYYSEISLIIKRGKTSPRLRYMLQDVLDQEKLHL